MWSGMTSAAITVVIHTNRGGEKTNGKLGVMLDQKCDCSYIVDIDFDTWVSKVKHKESRDLRTPNFEFRQDMEGSPRLLGIDPTNYDHL